jgi:hypothetical protein
MINLNRLMNPETAYGHGHHYILFLFGNSSNLIKMLSLFSLYYKFKFEFGGFFNAADYWTACSDTADK